MIGEEPAEEKAAELQYSIEHAHQHGKVASDGRRKCSLCYKPGAEMACPRCNVEVYCDRKCQKRHWKRHRPGCDSPQAAVNIAEARIAAAAAGGLLLTHDCHSGLQRELVARKTLLMEMDVKKELNMSHIIEHATWLSRLSAALGKQRDDLEKRIKITAAVTRQGKHRPACRDRMDTLMQQQAAYNENASCVMREQNWFFTSPSFKKAYEHVNETSDNINGCWIEKTDKQGFGVFADEDPTTSGEAGGDDAFTALLKEMKSTGLDGRKEGGQKYM